MGHGWMCMAPRALCTYCGVDRYFVYSQTTSYLMNMACIDKLQAEEVDFVMECYGADFYCVGFVVVLTEHR